MPNVCWQSKPPINQIPLGLNLDGKTQKHLSVNSQLQSLNPNQNPYTLNLAVTLRLTIREVNKFNDPVGSLKLFTPNQKDTLWLTDATHKVSFRGINKKTVVNDLKYHSQQSPLVGAILEGKFWAKFQGFLKWAIVYNRSRYFLVRLSSTQYDSFVPRQLYTITQSISPGEGGWVLKNQNWLVCISQPFYWLTLA